MQKGLTLSFVASLSILATMAQKPKATFEHEAFGKKVSLYLSTNVTSFSPKEADIQYISTTTGQSIDDLKSQNDLNIKALKEDATAVMTIPRILDKVEVIVIEENPIKKADIILYNHYKDKSFTLTLTNCIQTNTTWVLGDRIIPKGDGFEDLVKRNDEKKAKAENSFFGKAVAVANKGKAATEERQAKADSIEAVLAKIPGYHARSVSFDGEYYDKNMYGKCVSSFYITKEGAKRDAIIFSDLPFVNLNYYLSYGASSDGSRPANFVEEILLCKEASTESMANKKADPNFDKSISKKTLLAFADNANLYVQSMPDKWYILVSEGAIRKLANLGSNNEPINFIQKLKLEPVSYNWLRDDFKVSMSFYTSEHAELAAKIKKEATGYKFENLDNIIIEYNAWYVEKFPGKVEYLPLGIVEAQKKALAIEKEKQMDLAEEKTRLEGLSEETKQLVGYWLFSKMLEGDKDMSDQYPLGKANGKPSKMYLDDRGVVEYQKVISDSQGIMRALWKVEGSNLEFNFIYSKVKGKENATEKYTVIKATVDELIYEDKTINRRYFWTKIK